MQVEHCLKYSHHQQTCQALAQVTFMYISQHRVILSSGRTMLTFFSLVYVSEQKYAFSINSPYYSLLRHFRAKFHLTTAYYTRSTTTTWVRQHTGK
jgi:hypothetical protein